MPIVRLKKHTDPFVIIDKRALNDERLSWKAKGLIAYLLSKPDDWTVVVEELARRSRGGERLIRSGLNELRRIGYAAFGPSRDRHGRLTGTAWTIYETPRPTTETAVLPTSVKSDGRKRSMSAKKRPTNNKPTPSPTLRTNIPNGNTRSQLAIEKELLTRLRVICGPEEMKEHGAMWRTFIRKPGGRRALENTFEDLKLRGDNYRNKPLRNPAAWMNKRFHQNLRLVQSSTERAKEIPDDQDKLRRLVRESVNGVPNANE